MAIHLIWYYDWWRKIDVHDILEAILTSKMAKMACLSPDLQVNTWDMVLKAILSHLGQAHMMISGEKLMSMTF